MSDTEKINSLKDLLVRSQGGDQVVYQQLLREIWPLVLNAVKYKINDRQYAEDVAQTVMMKMHLSLHTFDPSFSLAAWIRTIVRNALIDHFKYQKRIQSESSSSSLLEAQASDSSSDERILVEQSIDQLSEKHKQAILLTKVAGLSIEEGARFLGISEVSFKVRIHRAHQSLKKITDRE